jgi:hypothetical protein
MLSSPVMAGPDEHRRSRFRTQPLRSGGEPDRREEDRTLRAVLVGMLREMDR